MILDTFLLIASIAVTLAGFFIIGLLPSGRKAVANALLVFVNALLTSIPAFHVLGGLPLEWTLPGWSFLGSIPIRIDALSAWFILIINFTAVTGSIYGIGYMKSYATQRFNLSLHWMLFLLFHSSMLWVCIVQHSFVFLIVWELMSISSFLLVIFEHNNQRTLQAGLNYFIQMHISVAILTAAFIWVYCETGSYDFNAIGAFFLTHRNIGLFLLFFAGFGIKAGFIPLHSWLPHAHPSAPSHVSGVMSGVIVKLGIFGIFRILLQLKADMVLLGEIVLTLSVLTGLFGILNAAVHRDFKKMLAYCTIENIGIIGSGIGIGLIGLGTSNDLVVILGLGGALLHTLNHSLFKSLLFFSAGSVYQQTHTRDMEKLGGLLRKMPRTGFLFLIGALAIGGMPPFNGFVSEFLLYLGYLEGIKTLDVPNATLMMFSLASMAMIGGISILAFTKSFGTIFLGTPRTSLEHKPSEVSRVMLLPQYLILALMLTIGLFPQLFLGVLVKPLSLYLPALSSFPSLAATPALGMISTIGRYSFVFLLLAGTIYFLRNWLTRRRVALRQPTWGCSYVAPHSGMQYTGKSFSKTLGKLFNFITIEQKKYEERPRNEIFPLATRHSSHYVDFFETRIINGLVKKLVYSMNYFQFVQNGKTQAYVLYGVCFILLVFLGTLFNLI